MKISIENIVLSHGNSKCEEPKDLKIQGSKELQVSHLLRAKEVMVFDRGNTKITVTFRVARQHSSADEALINTMTHTEAVTSIHGNATFDIEDDDFTVFHLTNASVRNVSSHINGLTSYHAYEIIGSKIETTLCYKY